jgi:hypothetical protein
MVESSIPLDHIATWSEVCDALAYSRRDASESGPAGGCDMEFAVDLNNGVGCLSEELAWFRVANEALDSRPN